VKYIHKTLHPQIRGLVPEEIVTKYLDQCDTLEYGLGIRELQSLLSFIRERNCKVLCDIGCNIGYHTINYAHHIPDSTVYSFDPCRDNVNIVEKNIEHFQLDNITVNHKAVSNKVGKEKVYVNYTNSGDTRIFASSDYTPGDIYDVETTTLDEYFKDTEALDYLKLDTQGCELEIFSGGKNVITHHRPIIYLEFWPYAYTQRGHGIDDLIHVIHECNYKIRCMSPTPRLTGKYFIGPMDEDGILREGNGRVPQDVSAEYVIEFYEQHANKNTHINLLLY
jgi:FkbM family methyltransferase